MNIIILGDKYQKRMKSKGCSGLIPKNNKTNILQHQYDVLSKCYNSKIYYVYGFDSKKMDSFIAKNPQIDINLIYNNTYEEYNDVYSLSLASEYLFDDILILFGHTIIGHKFTKTFDNTLGSQIFINNNTNSNIGCIIDNNTISHISFDLSNVLAGIYYISREDMNLIRQYIVNFSYRNYFLFEMINILINIQTDKKIRPFYI